MNKMLLVLLKCTYVETVKSRSLGNLKKREKTNKKLAKESASLL